VQQCELVQPFAAADTFSSAADATTIQHQSLAAQLQQLCYCLAHHVMGASVLLSLLGH
jgi:hypothetical protein